MQNSTKLYSILCLILVVCISYATSQPSFQQPGAPPNIGGFPQGPGGPTVGGFPQAPSGFPQGPGGFPQAQGPAPGGFPQGPGAGFANGAGGANSFNAYNSFGNNLGGLGGFGTANPGLGGLGGLGGLNAANPGLGGFGVPNARGFGAGTPTGFGNVGFGQPAVQSAAPFRAANAPAATFQANPLTSVFGGGQNIGAGMSVDQMRTLDNALFGNGANIFQTEQPSATFSYPLNQRVQQQTYQTVPDATNTYTTQQFGAGPMMGPGATPFGPGMATPGPGVGGFGNPAASSLLNSALLNGMGGGMNPYGYGQQQQVNPAYSSLTTGFNDLLSGVGSGLTNAGRNIASGYAPPSLNPNPTTGYTQNTAARTSISPGNPVPTAASSPSYSSYVNSAAAGDAEVPMTTNPSNYGTSAQNTLTATYPGIGLVDLGVPIIGHQSTETTDSPTRFRTSTSATPPLQSAERVSIMQAKRQQVN